MCTLGEAGAAWSVPLASALTLAIGFTVCAACAALLLCTLRSCPIAEAEGQVMLRF